MMLHHGVVQNFYKFLKTLNKRLKRISGATQASELLYLGPDRHDLPPLGPRVGQALGRASR